MKVFFSDVQSQSEIDVWHSFEAGNQAKDFESKDK